MSQIKKGALLNYTTIVLTNVVSLLLTPFIIQKVGDAEYGIYIAIGALVGSISVLDFGLNNTVIRFVAKYQAEKNLTKERDFLGTVILLYIGISSIILIVGSVFYYNIDTYYSKMSPSEIEIAEIMSLILIFNLAIKLPGGVFMGICSGYEQFVFPKTLNIIRYIIRSAMVVGVLLLGGKAIAIVIIDTLMNIIVIGASAYYVIKKLKVRFTFNAFQLSFIKHILGYSVWIFIFSLVGMFQWKAGHIVLGALVKPEVLAIYGIGIMLGTYYGAFSTAISSVFLPRAAKMSVGKASGEELTTMMIKVGRLSFIVLLYILIAFVLFGKQFINLWVGSNYYDSWIIAVMIMVAYTVPLVQGFGNSILEAKNKISFKAVLYLSFMLLGTGAGAYLAKSYGAIGMITGSMIGWIIVQNIMNVYYQKVIGLNIIRFFKGLFSKLIIVGVLVSIIGYFINYIPGAGWLNFGLKGILFSMAYAVLIFSLGMYESEKKLFTDGFNSVYLKFKKA
ncbi:lipopolysaccharide biosynthesis protein [Aquimarina sp. W85]|uniref:lipopolysaccharide biosynthesis protein n=1 Tax=Aquimarina rhodophyticola TaxID=3342246 RepID=UPI00366D5F90